jgi:hypothetical protein
LGRSGREFAEQLGNSFLAHFGPAAMRSATHLLPAVLLFALLAFPACDNAGDTEAPEINGEWSGSIVDPNTGNGVSMSFVLTENESSVTGNGDLNIGGGTASMDVSGTYDYPDVDLLFSVRNPDPDFEGFDIDYEGEITESGEVMNGTLQFEGATEEGEIQFVRQE